MGNEDQTQVVPLSVLLLNDSDANGDPLTISSVHDPVNGAVQMTSTHAVFVPDADFFGDATFVYTACDPGNLCSDAIVTVTLDPVADAPRPSDDDYIVTAGTILNVTAPGVLANDLEPDGELLTVNSSLVPGLTGTMSMNSNGSLTYIPTPLFTGQDSGTYTLCDPTNLCATATITITVSPNPSSSQSLYMTGAGSGGFSFGTSPPPVANPEPDPDNDNKPGLTMANSSQTGYLWIYQLPSATSLAGPVTLDLYSAVKNFNNSEDATLAADLLVCDTGGTNCVSVLQRQWTFKPWNVGGATTWTERQLTIGTINTTLPAGSELRLVLTPGKRDLWVALSGDRPSALQLTV